MRRFILHIVSLLILLASTGLKLEAHYCHGHFAGIKFVYNSCCCDEKKADCCEDKVIQVEKADFEYSPKSLQKTDIKHLSGLNIFTGHFSKNPYAPVIKQKIIERSDPPELFKALYIFYGRLLHYG